MEQALAGISEELQVSINDILEVYHVRGGSIYDQLHWEKHTALRNRLRGLFYLIDSAVEEALDNVIRASSLIENLNSRLRNYFTLRRHLENSYLEILQFFLNHRRFLRSDHVERVGKSPAELLTGVRHNHWLEILGFDLFKRAA